jgi:heme-degrading monooxygenase HmoA
MSVIVMLKVKGDPAALEAYAGTHADQMRRIADDGKAKGAVHHLFAAGDGEVVVIDEWPDEASFKKFFSSQAEIPEVMKGGGTKGTPEITFLRKLATHDSF